MTEESTEPTRLKLLILFITAAPLWLLLFLALPGDMTRKELYPTASLIGANLVWAAGLLTILLYGELLLPPLNTAMARIHDAWVAIDPNLVWHPWQAVVLILAIGLVMMAVSVPKVASELREPDKEEA